MTPYVFILLPPKPPCQTCTLNLGFSKSAYLYIHIHTYTYIHICRNMSLSGEGVAVIYSWKVSRKYQDKPPLFFHSLQSRFHPFLSLCDNTMCHIYPASNPGYYTVPCIYIYTHRKSRALPSCLPAVSFWGEKEKKNFFSLLSSALDNHLTFPFSL